MGKGGGSKVHVPPPSAPTPVPTDTSAEAIEAQDKEKKRLKAAFSGGKTILTGATLGAADTTKRTALG